MSYKTFQNGFPLPASDLNNYLMNQVVATFANSTARSAAIAAPQEGQVTYLEDTNLYYKWDGSAWVELQGMQSQVSQALSPNYIINGAFDIWQRGTSFSVTTSNTNTADRWRIVFNGSGATRTVSQQAFSPADLTASAFGDAQFYLRMNQSVAGTSGTFNILRQPIEDVRTFAGQTATISFWAKSTAANTLSVRTTQNFGSGGSSTLSATAVDFTLTSSWVRYSAQFVIPTISGKTLGANNFLAVDLLFPNNTTFEIDIWGVQLEAGSVATPFKRAANTLQGELAACQRYYFRFMPQGSGGAAIIMGAAYSTTAATFVIPLPSTMRRNVTAVDFADITVEDIGTGTNSTPTAITLNPTNTQQAQLLVTGMTGLTQYRPYILRSSNATGYLGVTAEL